MPLPPNNLNFDCDWKFGLNVDPSKKGIVGYVLFWSGCGGLSLSQDITVRNPFSSTGQTVVSGAQIQCVGLIERFRFAGGSDDPIRISAYVSKSAAANLRGTLASPLTNTNLNVRWYILGYDEETKAWYEGAFISGAGANVDAVVDTINGELQLFVANAGTPILPHLDVQVYEMEFQIVPADGSSANLQFATGPTTKVVRQWGAPASGG